MKTYQMTDGDITYTDFDKKPTTKQIYAHYNNDDGNSRVIIERNGEHYEIYTTCHKKHIKDFKRKKYDRIIKITSVVEEYE